MAVINGDPLSLVITALFVGCGAGIGTALGTAFYRAFLEDIVNKFLDKKHHEERLKLLKEKFTKFGPPTESNRVVKNILGDGDDKDKG